MTENVNPIQVEKFLKGMNYPASKSDLLKHVKQHGADKNIEETLKRLPDQQFDTPTDISQAIGVLNRQSS